MAVAALGVIPPTIPGAPSADAAGLAAGGEYHPVSPTRIYDSRNGIGTTVGKRSHNVPFDAAVLGLGGVPTTSTDVLAVVLNVTVVEPSNDGFISIYPKGSPPAVPSSLVNFAQNANVPNLAIVGVGRMDSPLVSL